MKKQGAKNQILIISGFTLVEIIVSLGLFSIVVMVALGALLSITYANERVQASAYMLGNLNSAMEEVTRHIRFGKNFHCGASGNPSYNNPQDCPSGATLLSFCEVRRIATGEGLFVYRLNNNRLERSVSAGPGITGAWIPITSPEIIVNDLKFYVAGSLRTDNAQPRIMFVIDATIPEREKTRTRIKLQTTTVQRLPDIAGAALSCG